MLQRQLKDGYSIQEIDTESFQKIFQEEAPKIFDDNMLTYFPRQLVSDIEKEKTKKLGERLGNPYRVNLILQKDGALAGWSFGFQESSETFYMCNSAVLPSHRKRGLYTELMSAIIACAEAEGFQRIYSRHSNTNNAVLIPKLKAGFQITNMEVSDIYGTLVHLTYFPNPMRRKALQFRVGELRPDEELKKWFKI